MKELFSILSDLHAFKSARKAIRNIPKVAEVLETVTEVVEDLEPEANTLEEILRNAMGYAYEIGRGVPMREQIVTSAHNPFLNPNWRDFVIPGQEA